MRDFFWGFKDNQNHHLYLKRWNQVCQPKEHGGLGIRNMGDFNEAMISKLAWQVTTDDQNIWTQLIHAKYLRG